MLWGVITSLLLLPGMDGTGRMFAPLIARLPASLEPRAIAYPGDRALGGSPPRETDDQYVGH
jgi:hypothetical protein